MGIKSVSTSHGSETPKSHNGSKELGYWTPRVDQGPSTLLCSYPSLEVVTAREGEHRGFRLWATGEVRRWRPLKVVPCTWSSFQEAGSRTEVFPGPSCCQVTVPLPEGADRAGPSIMGKPLESNNSILISTPYTCGTLDKLLNLSEPQFLYL